MTTQLESGSFPEALAVTNESLFNRNGSIHFEQIHKEWNLKEISKCSVNPQSPFELLNFNGIIDGG